MKPQRETQDANAGSLQQPCSALPDYGHLMDYVLDLHIITGPNGMCRCGEDGITCSERLRCVSHEIGSALLGAYMAKQLSAIKNADRVLEKIEAYNKRNPPNDPSSATGREGVKP